MKDNPLTERDRQQINKSLRSAEEIQELVNAAKEAGIEGADELCTRLGYCRDNLVKMKQVYFKGKP